MISGCCERPGSRVSTAPRNGVMTIDDSSSGVSLSESLRYRRIDLPSSQGRSIDHIVSCRQQERSATLAGPPTDQVGGDNRWSSPTRSTSSRLRFVSSISNIRLRSLPTSRHPQAPLSLAVACTPRRNEWNTDKAHATRGSAPPQFRKTGNARRRTANKYISATKRRNIGCSRTHLPGRRAARRRERACGQHLVARTGRTSGPLCVRRAVSADTHIRTAGTIPSHSLCHRPSDRPTDRHWSGLFGCGG